VLIANFSNQPCLNIQAGRGVIVRDIAFKGLLRPWIESHHLCESADFSPQVDPTIDDTVAANWWDPGLAASGDSRYAPYAAITIDAYRGTQPATHYPDITFPAFTGISSQYNKGASSATRIENISIIGFNTGIAVQPCNGDGNGDFTQVSNAFIEMCKWGVSVGNTQSRDVNLSNIRFNQVYCCLTDNTHGVQEGKFSGELSDISAGACIQIFNFTTTAYAGPLLFSSFYGEALWRIGDINANASSENSVIFVAGEFNFGLQNTRRGVPATVLTKPAQCLGMAFKGCSFYSFPSVLLFNTLNVDFDDACVFMCDARPWGGTVAPYEALAHNFLSGGCVVPFLRVEGKHRVRNNIINLDTLAWGANAVTHEPYRLGERTYCIPMGVQTVQSANSQARDAQSAPQYTGIPWDKSTDLAGGISMSGLVLTLTFTSLPDYRAWWEGCLPGDVLLDDASGTVFFIRSRTGNTVIAEAQNNHKNGSLITALTTSSGYIYSGNSRFYAPLLPLFVTATAGNAVLTNAGRADGYSAWLDTATFIAPGDRLYWAPDVDGFGDPTYANITAINGTAKTITLAAGPFISGTRRVPVLVRQPPANRATR
jgi:hypothetical protein